MTVLCSEPCSVHCDWRNVAIALGISNYQSLTGTSDTVSLHNVLCHWQRNPQPQYPFTYHTIIEALKNPIVANTSKAHDVEIRLYNK